MGESQPPPGPAALGSVVQCSVVQAWSWEDHGRITGGSWEDHGRITGGSWEDHGRINGVSQPPLAWQHCTVYQGRHSPPDRLEVVLNSLLCLVQKPRLKVYYIMHFKTNNGGLLVDFCPRKDIFRVKNNIWGAQLNSGIIFLFIFLLLLI